MEQELCCKSFNIIIGQSQHIIVYSIEIKDAVFHDAAVLIP